VADLVAVAHDVAGAAVPGIVRKVGAHAVTIDLGLGTNARALFADLVIFARRFTVPAMLEGREQVRAHAAAVLGLVRANAFPVGASAAGAGALAVAAMLFAHGRVDAGPAAV
jgi:hypothetical protein